MITKLEEVANKLAKSKELEEEDFYLNMSHEDLFTEASCRIADCIELKKEVEALTKKLIETELREKCWLRKLDYFGKFSRQLKEILEQQRPKRDLTCIGYDPCDWMEYLYKVIPERRHGGPSPKPDSTNQAKSPDQPDDHPQARTKGGRSQRKERQQSELSKEPRQGQMKVSKITTAGRVEHLDISHQIAPKRKVMSGSSKQRQTSLMQSTTESWNQSTGSKTSRQT
ncbi:hypothetical protein ACS0TY_023912 [Phlomoides rotata]